MRNKKNQSNMCDVTHDLQTHTSLQTAKCSQNTSSPGAGSTLCTAVKHLKSTIQ